MKAKALISIIKMMLEESHCDRIWRGNPREHNGRIEALEETHNGCSIYRSLTSIKSFRFHFTRTKFIIPR